MKNAERTAESIRNLDQLISKLSENEILSAESMSYVKGGEGDGGEVVITKPKF
jgi:hypothetical protein